jgi:HD-GYP domain-containing protein (c-di-GMP phosphodiesterase class II)
MHSVHSEIILQLERSRDHHDGMISAQCQQSGYLRGDFIEARSSVIKIHPMIGTLIIQYLEHFTRAMAIVGQYHEQSNRYGYIYGFRENQITVSAIIMPVAEISDVHTTTPFYRGG